jgi:hypothetical protein
MNRTIEEEILIEISGLKTHIQVDVVYNFFLSITFPTRLFCFWILLPVLYQPIFCFELLRFDQAKFSHSHDMFSPWKFSP